MNLIVHMLYELSFLKSFKKDENDVDLGPSKGNSFAIFETLCSLLDFMHKKEIPLEIEVNWKDLYDFLFGQFHLKQFQSLANNAVEETNYNVKFKRVAHT